VRKLVYYVAVTLDGFIAGPVGSDPVGTSYFPLHEDLIEFIVAEFPETLPGAARQAMGIDDVPHKHFDTVLEGRGSYEVGLDAGVTNATRTCATSCSRPPWDTAPTRRWSS
jgi:hypothetical protein